MWKDSEFCSKRDDDSAIGDSANNSAGEESTNSRRKSSISDDVDDLQSEPHAHLASKVGTKIPDCLLKDSEEHLQNCKRFWKPSPHNGSKSKRVIRTLPTISIQNKSLTNTNPQAKGQHNMSALEAKLQQLFLEMKQLRELDRVILRKFIDINDGVDEMRWKLAENEAALRQNMMDGDVDDDIIMTLSESRLKEWNDLDTADAQNDEELSSTILVTTPPSPLASMTYVKSSRKAKTTQTMSSITSSAESASSPEVHSIKSPQSDKPREYENLPAKPRAYSNATYNHVDEKGGLTPSPHQGEKQAAKSHGDSPAKVIDLEKLSSTNYYRFKSPHPSPAIVPVASVADIWVKKETTLASQDHVPSSSSEMNRSHRPTSASNLARKYSDRVQQQQNSRKNPNAFDSTAQEKHRLVVRSQWTMMEKKAKSTSDFHKQRDYKHLVGLSRVSGHSGQVVRQKSFSKPSDSADSLNSSSSTTSPPRNPVMRSNSASKWSRFGLRRSSKSINIHNTNNSNGVVIVNNNYKPNRAEATRSNDVRVTSYKQRTSSDVYKWVQSQDDVTFL